jgi:predicted nucleotidyltransferase
MTTDHPFGLSPATLEKLNSVFAQHNAIDSVVIYGSRAKGNYRTGSDIDLTIKGGGIPFSEFMQIENQIDDLMLAYTVDLSQYRQLENADLIAHIERVGMEIYARDNGHNVAVGGDLAKAKV